MTFKNLKRLYMVSCVALFLIILSPTLVLIISFPAGENFSEMWILGSTHMGENYPLNVSAGTPYAAYLGIGNHMGKLEYYAVRVKLLNQSESSPDIKAGVPSSLPTLFEYRVFLRNHEVWEKHFSFSFEKVSLKEKSSEVAKLMFDGFYVDVKKTSQWDTVNRGFYYQLFFELWIYNSTISKFQFHNRSAWLWLNLYS
jgi:uncharacterized membrane protein